MPTLLELVKDIDYSREVGPVLADLRRVLAGHEFPLDAPKTPPLVIVGGGTGSPAVGRALHAVGQTTFTIVANPAEMSRDPKTLEPRGSGAISAATGGLNWADMLGPLLFAQQNESRGPLAAFLHGKVGDTRRGYFVLQALAERYGVQGAIDRVGQMLGNTWRVLPATTASTELKLVVDGQHRGQYEMLTLKAERGYVLPEAVVLDPPAATSAETLHALTHAQAVIVGPGDLHYSVLPNFRTLGFFEALAANPRACLVLPVNLSWRAFDTPNFTVRSFLDRWNPDFPLEREVVALVNTQPIDFPEIIKDDLDDSDKHGRFKVVRRPIASSVLSRNGQPLHDPVRFGQALGEILRAGQS